jgi:hypothetical protein
VENLWTKSANPVENLTRKKSFRVIGGNLHARPLVERSSRLASLDRDQRLRRMQPASLPRTATYVTVHALNGTHRFNETIGGRAYQIEVTPVSNRWRAQLCRTPGLPTAMMPFYGTTPDEAARQLTKWLQLAHGTRNEKPNPQAVRDAEI